MIHPAGYRILAKPDSVLKEHKVEGSDIKIELALDEKLEEGATVTGTVVEVGPIAFQAFQIGAYGEYQGKPWVSPGMKIIWAKYSGKHVMHKGEKYVFLNDQDIVGWDDEE